MFDRPGRIRRAGSPSSAGDSLKSTVRDFLMRLKFEERVDFIQAFEAEMRRESLSIRTYLIPIGIAGNTVEELSPTEVGHLIRYLLMCVPGSIPAIERVLCLYQLSKEKDSPMAA